MLTTQKVTLSLVGLLVFALVEAARSGTPPASRLALTAPAGDASAPACPLSPAQAEIPINDKASIGDGEMTWLQFGASGSKDPNALLTYGQEVGITVGRGSNNATAGEQECSGDATVTASTITGNYTCHGVPSYDNATRKMGKVDIVIRFTAKS